MIDLDSPATREHTSSFTKSDVTGNCEIEGWLKSGTGSTRVEDRVRIEFTNKDQVPLYPSDFPGTTVRLVQAKMLGKLRLAAPGV